MQDKQDLCIQEIAAEDLDAVSGGFIFLVALAAVALSGCFAHCGTPPVQHP